VFQTLTGQTLNTNLYIIILLVLRDFCVVVWAKLQKRVNALISHAYKNTFQLQMSLSIPCQEMYKLMAIHHCDKDNANDVDVMTKVKVLEQSMDSFMKQQGEQMRNLTETMGSFCQNRPPPQLPPPVDNRVRSLRRNENVARDRSVSPSKRPRIEEGGDAFEKESDTAVKVAPPSYASAAGSRTNNQRVNDGSTNGNTNRPRRQSTLVFGAARTGKGDTEELLAADANLVASGVSKDATC
jgi:hypothetical protein